MAPFNVDDVVQVRLIYQAAGREACNIRHFRVDDVLGSPDAQHFADYLRDNFLDSLVRIIPPVAKLRWIAVWNLADTSTPAEAVNEVNQPGIWTTSNLLPPQVAGLLTFTTTVYLGRNAPKLYSCFPPTTANGVNGIPSNLYWTRLRSLGDVFSNQHFVDDGVNLAVLTPVVLHQATLTVTEITGRVASFKWATRRRRSHSRRAPAFVFH